MDQHEFEAQLKVDGYQEIKMQELAARPAKRAGYIRPINRNGRHSFPRKKAPLTPA
jgi:hypothetical protein